MPERRRLLCHPLAAAALAVLLAACASPEPLTDPRQPLGLADVQEAVVLSVRPLTAGPALSSITAAREQLFVGAAGVVAGAVTGQSAPAAAARESSVELLLRLQNGEQRSVVQPAGGERLAAGDTVFIVAAGGQLRVLRKQATTPR